MIANAFLLLLHRHNKFDVVIFILLGVVHDMCPERPVRIVLGFCDAAREGIALINAALVDEHVMVTLVEHDDECVVVRAEDVLVFPFAIEQLARGLRRDFTVRVEVFLFQSAWVPMDVGHHCQVRGGRHYFPVFDEAL